MTYAVFDDWSDQVFRRHDRDLILAVSRSVDAEELAIVRLELRWDLVTDSHGGLHLRVTQIVVVTNLEAAEVGCDEADDQGNELEDEKFVNEVSVICVRPVRVIQHGVVAHSFCPRWHHAQSRQLALLPISVLVCDNDRGEEENAQEVVAEDADHAGTVDPATQDKKQRIHGHKDEGEAGEGVDN